jgi:hypothetical protein
MDHNHPDRELDAHAGQRFRHLRTHRAAVLMTFSLSGLQRFRRRPLGSFGMAL